MNVLALVASIPSPGSSAIGIGPLRLNAYGLFIALGVIAAVWLCGRRFVQAGVAPREAAGDIAVWAVLAGIVGARLYHVVTDWHRFEDDPGAIVKIWSGGLGIPGGLLAGVLVGIWRVRRLGLDVGAAVNAAIPGVPLAQAIGRLGNWFNQELYGRPTDVPWALRIDPEHRPADLLDQPTFHPTFLYELLWNLGLCGALVWLDRRVELRRGGLLAVYVAGYAIGRFWVEGLRIDSAHEAAGLRLNQWVALVALVAAGGYIALLAGTGQIRRRGPVSGTGADGDGDVRQHPDVVAEMGGDDER